MGDIDKLILQEFSWDAYNFTPSAFKPKIEGCLLTQIVVQSNDPRIDKNQGHWENCEKILSTDSKFRTLLLECWKQGSFERIRNSSVIHSSTAAPASGTTIIHHGSTFTEVHGDNYTINNNPPYKSPWVSKWLCPFDHGAVQRTMYQRRTEGTCQWFFESPSLKTWLKDPTKRILFCTGIPGVGKSVLASTMVQYLDHLGHGPVCFAYLDYKRRSDQSLVHILGAILRELFEYYDPFVATIRDLFSLHSFLTLTEALNALTSLTKKVDALYLVLDGLDEYLEQYSDEAIETLRDTLMSIPKLKVMITTRITGNMKKIFDVDYTVHQEIHTSETDMIAYLKDRISKEVPQRFREDLQDPIIKGITEVAKQRFLLAKLHMDLVASRLTIGEMRDTLKALSEEVDHVYRQAIERIDNQVTRQRDLARTVLMWVACTKRNLTVIELQHALVAVSGDPYRDVKQYIYPEELLTSVCAGLVVINEALGVVQFVHYTAQEFFERAKDEYFPDADLKIATTCCDYMRINPYPYSDGPSFVFTLLDHLPFYRYISEHFGTHLKHCNLNPLELLCDSRENCWWGCPFTQGVKVLMAILCMEGHHERYKWSGGSWKKAHLLAALDHVPLLDQVISEGEDWNEQEYRTKYTPLTCAIKVGAMNTTRYLLARGGMDINTADRKQECLLTVAIRHGRTEVANMLLDWADIDLNSKNINGRTPLHTAVIYDRFDIFMKLMAIPIVDVNARDEEGETPLFHATRYRLEEMAKILLQDTRVICNPRNNRGRTPLMATLIEETHSMIDILLSKDSFSSEFEDEDRRTYLSWAAGNGFLSITRTLLSLPASPVDKPDKSGRTPLSHTASGGHSEIFSILLGLPGVEPHSVDSDACTPLFYASKNGFPAIVQSLLSTGDKIKPSLSLETKQGQTPLSIACAEGHTQVVKYLIHAGADIHKRDHDGRAPLSHAASRCHSSIVRILLGHGADPNDKDNTSWTPLHHFIDTWDNGETECITTLLDAGADINCQNDDGTTPLMRAIDFRRLEKIKILRQRGARVDLRDKWGKHALFYAASDGPAWLVKELVRELKTLDIGVDSTDMHGWTPLMYAINRCMYTCVEVLIEEGADLNARDLGGRTGVSNIAECYWYWEDDKEFGYKAITRRLLEAGADINLPDNEGKTPLDYAHKKDHWRQDAIDFLTSVGAIRNVSEDVEGDEKVANTSEA